jgi:hypothetical protein
VLGLDADAVLERAARYAEPLSAADGETLRKLEEIVGGLYAEAEGAAIGLDAYVGSGLAEELPKLAAT